MTAPTGPTTAVAARGSSQRDLPEWRSGSRPRPVHAARDAAINHPAPPRPPAAEVAAALDTLHPFDHLGRIAWQVIEERRLGGSPAESFCPDPHCGERMTPRQGDGIATHFAHVCAAGEISSCTKAGESIWHLAVKMAAAAGGENAGWRLEHAYDAGGHHYRADIYHPRTQTFIEAVNTLSDTYVRKHHDTAAAFAAPLWYFNTAAPFRAGGLEAAPIARFDRQEAKAGRLVATSLLNKHARTLIEAIGREHCFCHFYGLAFQCLTASQQRDVWQALPLNHVLNQITRGDDRLNHLLVEYRIRPCRREAAGPLVIGVGTDWSPQPEYVIEDVLKYRAPQPRPLGRSDPLPFGAASTASGEEMFNRKRAGECPWSEHAWMESERASRGGVVWFKATCQRCGKFYGWRPEGVPSVTQHRTPSGE